MKKKTLNFPLKSFFVDLFKEKIYLVGGTIRDFLLYNKVSKQQDIDLVVIDHKYEDIEKKLNKFGKTNTVGKSFAVVKFSKGNYTFDIAVPRKDIIRDPGTSGHKNFIVEYGPQIKLEEDLKRRDFTCNSIAMRLIDDEMIDPFNGRKSIKERRVEMTGPETFNDDPLRILRAARFASVHQFSVDPEIYRSSQRVKLSGLSKERICEEFFRLLLESERPSLGLNEYFYLRVLEKLFLPLFRLTLTIQDSIFHPEKDQFGHHSVWGHTLIAVDIAKKLSVIYKLGEVQTLALLLAVLFHDVGKAYTTIWEYKRGRMTITSKFHDARGVDITDEFFKNLKIETRKNFPIKQTVLDLIKYHHRIYELYRNREEISFKAISRLVRDLEDHDFLLVLLDFADRQSREENPLDFDDIDDIAKWYLDQKKIYNIRKETVQPIIMGRDLIQMGISPGIQMGDYLKQLYELQLDGEFKTKEQGLKIFKRLMGNF